MGSEMCIRDRVPGAQIIAEKEGVAALEERQQRRRGNRGHIHTRHEVDEVILGDDIAVRIAVRAVNRAMDLEDERTSGCSLVNRQVQVCLLYTSDAADERSSVDLGGRRVFKKKKKNSSAD